MFSIQLRNAGTLNLENGKFEGDKAKARTAIEKFTLDPQNTFAYESLGWGYATLTINETKYDITPYGIDFQMMLRWCDIDETTLEPKVAAAASTATNPMRMKLGSPITDGESSLEDFKHAASPN